MYVELDVYSGRQNPVWELTDDEARQVLERFAGRTLGEVAELPDRLGYRGVIVSMSSDDAHVGELPPRFAVGARVSAERAGAAGTAAILSEQETRDAARWLLGTSGAGYAVEESTHRHVDQVLAQAVPEETTEADVSAPDIEADAPCQPHHTPFNPGFWNNDPYVRENNNCYNYAVNNRTNTFAQPGRQCGHEYTSFTCAAVRSAALCDGVLATCSGQCRYVALVIAPGQDYHWYRYHSNKFWGHKPGRTNARNTDNQGRVIGGTLNPANCDRGPYTQFCGYFWVPVGLRIR
jgi:hypothetical protein